MCPMTKQGRKRLGEAVRQARHARELTIDAAAEQARLSPVTYARVEAGEAVRALTYAAVDRVLGWPFGTAEGVAREQTEPPAVGETARGDFTEDPAAVQLLALVHDLPDDQTARWYRLARALADALATEDERDLNARSENSGADGISAQNVAIDRSIGSHGELIVQAGPDGSAPATPAEREYADTVSDAALEKMRRKHLGE